MNAERTIRHRFPFGHADAPRAGTTPLLQDLTFGQIMHSNRRLLFRCTMAFAVLLAVGALAVSSKAPGLLDSYGLVAAASLVPLFFWQASFRGGLPALPCFVAQQAAIYLMPMTQNNTTLSIFSLDILFRSAVVVAVFLVLLLPGWKLGGAMVRQGPSRWPLFSPNASGTRTLVLRASLLLLSVGIAYEILAKMGVLALFPQGAIPVLRATTGAASVMGAFGGAFIIASSRNFGAGHVLYWSLLSTLLVLMASNFLLSNVTILIISAGIGLSLGAGRVPLIFLCCMGGALAFLNIGKFDMRGKYWRDDAPRIGLTDVPRIYEEWAEATFAKMTNRETNEAGLAGVQEDEGQSLLERMNNLFNLAFVIQAQESVGIEPLWGETYALIPPLFVPRILWPDKPWTQAGQKRLNVYFGRQQSEEDTEKVSIAWGFLPEAVGNFGPIGGAIFLGPVIGLLLGMLEAWSAGKRLLSIEGLVCTGVLLQILLSFEMVASVFMTATFQMLVALIAGGIIFRNIFASQQASVQRRSIR